MASLNKVHLIGTLGRDPEITYTPRGSAVTEISIAINRKWNDNGEWREEVTWVNITLWGKTAEACATYARKGHQLFVEGRLAVDQWEDKASGKKQSRMKVVGESIQFLTPKPSDNEEQPRRSQPSAQRQQAQAPPPDTGPKNLHAAAMELSDDDIPF
jgi:single-strand DNA-binding protein